MIFRPTILTASNFPTSSFPDWWPDSSLVFPFKRNSSEGSAVLKAASNASIDVRFLCGACNEPWPFYTIVAGRSHERLDLCTHRNRFGGDIQGKPRAECHAGRVQCCGCDRRRPAFDGKRMALLAGHPVRLSERRHPWSANRDRVHSLHDPERGAGGQLPVTHHRDRADYFRIGSVFLREGEPPVARVRQRQ